MVPNPKLKENSVCTGTCDGSETYLNTVVHENVIPHLHIRARASPRHLHKHLYASVAVRMNHFHMHTNIHMFVHVTRIVIHPL